MINSMLDTNAIMTQSDGSMSTMIQKKRIVELRAELGISQLALAQAAKLSQGIISRIEDGFPIREKTALQVLYGVNRLRKKEGLSELEFEEIEWNLSG